MGSRTGALDCEPKYILRRRVFAFNDVPSYFVGLAIIVCALLAT